MDREGNSQSEISEKDKENYRVNGFKPGEIIVVFDFSSWYEFIIGKIGKNRPNLWEVSFVENKNYNHSTEYAISFERITITDIFCL